MPRRDRQRAAKLPSCERQAARKYRYRDAFHNGNVSCNSASASATSPRSTNISAMLMRANAAGIVLPIFNDSSRPRS